MRVATWRDVARIVAGLPEATEASPGNWRVRKKLIAWERPLRKADYEALGADAPVGDILGARVADEGVTFALIADEPSVFFTTPHFDGYPAVLVRLAEITVCDLEELLTDAWLAQAPKSLVKSLFPDKSWFFYPCVRSAEDDLHTWLQQTQPFTAARVPPSPLRPSSLLTLSHSTRPARRKTRLP